jgi:immunity protein, SdpI family
VLFIFLGNYMGKLRRNFWAGIRTPWTLTSDVVWERTHRLGGWFFVLAGLSGVIMSFTPALHLWGLIVVILIVVIVLFVYSYVIYQHYTVEGKEPLSPPFDSGDRA